MNEYFSVFLDSIGKGCVERRTDFQSGNEAIYQNGIMLASTGCGNFSSPDLTETVKAEPHLVLFGSGHVGKALYDLGVLQGMRMTILDDRAELLTEERFPLAERFVSPFPELLKREYNALSPYFVIFTHGHAFDTDCLRYALSHPSSYIGMIGSKAKSAKALQILKDEGFSEKELENVHTPVGLSIGAETPEEIAVSIMAEIIACFRSEKHFSTADPALLRIMAEEHGIAVRIIAKHGSAPRATGSMMFVAEHGIHGTVGGGAIEAEAVEEAKKMLHGGRNTMIKEYNLSSDGDINMVCGGKATLLFSAV